MMVMVEGRCPRCWGCKQVGHIAKFCPQRPENEDKATTPTTKDAAATTITINKEAEAKGPGQVQPKSNQEGWTVVTKKRRGSPKQGEKSPSTSPPQKQAKAPAQAEAAATAEAPAAAAAAVATTAKSPVAPAAVAAAAPAAIVAAPRRLTNQKRPATPRTPAAPAPAPSPRRTKKRNKSTEDMETATGLKRRRDGGEGAAGRVCLERAHPEAGPSSQPQLPLPSPPLPSPLPPLPPPPFPPPEVALQSPPQQVDPVSPLSPQQEHFFRKYHCPYRVPLPRSQSAEGAQPSGMA